MSLGVTFMVTTSAGIKKLYLIEIQNDATGNEETGNYDVRLKSYENNNNGQVVATCRVEGYRRENGPLWLTKWAIEELVAKELRERIRKDE